MEKTVSCEKKNQVDEKKRECNWLKSGISTPKTNMSTEK